jgi:DNA polymerase elongation subunit (family B)
LSVPFGYLGFKNARFGKIDAHIATCAFSREYLQRAVAIAESNGFRLLHGIVDSMWLTKPGAGDDDYRALSQKIEKELDLPLSYEGRYKWIVFLNSRVNPGEPVLNRYYGVFQDGTIKVRGIELRRHDTPLIVNKCQAKMVEVLSGAGTCQQFLDLIPKALKVLGGYASLLRDGAVPFEDIIIEKNLSKNPDEYTNMVPQAIAAKKLVSAGGSVHAGQRVRYVLTSDASKRSGYDALPPELVDGTTTFNAEMYVDLLVRAGTNLFLPFGYDANSLKRLLK